MDNNELRSTTGGEASADSAACTRAPTSAQYIWTRHSPKSSRLGLRSLAIFSWRSPHPPSDCKRAAPSVCPRFGCVSVGVWALARNKRPSGGRRPVSGQRVFRHSGNAPIFWAVRFDNKHSEKARGKTIDPGYPCYHNNTRTSGGQGTRTLWGLLSRPARFRLRQDPMSPPVRRPTDEAGVSVGSFWPPLGRLDQRSCIRHVGRSHINPLEANQKAVHLGGTRTCVAVFSSRSGELFHVLAAHLHRRLVAAWICGRSGASRLRIGDCCPPTHRQSVCSPLYRCYLSRTKANGPMSRCVTCTKGPALRSPWPMRASDFN